MATAVPAIGATTASAATLHYSYSGYAFGTSVSVNGVVKSGNSALASLGCTTNGNLHKANNTAAVNISPLGSTGSVATTADTYASPVRSRTSATTNQVNLLGGRIRATAVKAVSTTTRTSTGFSVSASGTTVTGLVVNNVAVSANAAPNTRINLAGLGYLVVNEQVKRSYYGLTVSALRLVITTQNTLGVAVGTTAVVSFATSSLSNPVAGVVSGYAYSTQARVGTTFDSGPSFVVSLPCEGTGGLVKSNSGASVSIPGIATTGTVTNTAMGTVSAVVASAETTSSVQTADILSGVVRASAIKAVSRGSTNGTTYTFNDTGSSIGSLTIRGSNVGATAAPGTVVSVPGVGTVTLRKVSRTSRSITVIMIEVVLTQPVNSLPVGTVIRVGVSTVTIG